VPAAAVIPAPLAYTIIVAVKRLVVGLNKLFYYNQHCEQIRVLQTCNYFALNELSWNVAIYFFFFNIKKKIINNNII